MVVVAAADSGCKRVHADVADASATDASAEPAVDFEGKCVNETSGTPYQSIFFFPKKAEMFMYLGTTGAIRVPVSVTDRTPRKVSFTFRWSEKDELPSTRTGSVTAAGQKWQFELDTLKGSLCRPSPAPDFYRQLPDLGFPAGKWEDRKEHFGNINAADAQAWILSQKGQNTTIHYRVLEHTDNNVVVTSLARRRATQTTKVGVFRDSRAPATRSFTNSATSR